MRVLPHMCVSKKYIRVCINKNKIEIFFLSFKLERIRTYLKNMFSYYTQLFK